MIFFQLLSLLFLSVIISQSNSQKWPLSGTCYPCSCDINQEGFGRVKYVNCSDLALTRIPRNLPMDLHTLDFSNNRILPQELEQLCKFTAMQYVVMSYNELAFIPTQTFRNCHDLFHLNLTGNNITILDEDTFLGLVNLQELYGLEIDELLDNSFQRLTKLKTLEMTFNGDDIPSNIFENLNIQDLQLNVPLLQTLPNKLLISCVRTLKEISIVGPKITFLSENIFRGLAVLRKIYLNLRTLVSLPERIFHNNGNLEITSSKPQNLQEIWILNIGSIPSEIFKDLENLHTLVLHGIPSIPVSNIFEDLFNLEYLDITECHVNQVPVNWFQKLYSLKTLKLRQTGIRSIEPGVLDGLLNLQELDLSHNVMRAVQTESFTPIVQSIRKINFRGNMFKTIDDHLFKKMYNLVELDISDNKLETIHKYSFLDLRQLINLDIRDNKLSDLPDGLFKNLRNLQSLNLAMNTFNRFPETLNKVGYLLKLDISHNRIRSLPENVVQKFPYLELLNVDNNPLFCDCKSLDVKFYQPNLAIIGTCLAPDRFAWRRFSDIDVSECQEASSTVIEMSSLTETVYPSTSVYLSSSQPQSSVYIESSGGFLNSEAIMTSTDAFSSTIIFPTPSFISNNVTNIISSNNSSILFTSTMNWIPSTIYTTPNTTYSPPVMEEGIHEVNNILNRVVVRVSLGVLCGAVGLAGFLALVLWRRRVRRRKRYEVDANSTVV